VKLYLADQKVYLESVAGSLS